MHFIQQRFRSACQYSDGQSSARRKEALRRMSFMIWSPRFLLSSILRLHRYTIQRQWRRFPMNQVLTTYLTVVTMHSRNSTRFVLMNHTSWFGRRRTYSTSVRNGNVDSLRMCSMIPLFNSRMWTHRRSFLRGCDLWDFTMTSKTETSHFWRMHSILPLSKLLISTRTDGRLSCSSSGSSSTSRLRNSGALQRTLSEYKFALQS